MFESMIVLIFIVLFLCMFAYKVIVQSVNGRNCAIFINLMTIGRDVTCSPLELIVPHHEENKFLLARKTNKQTDMQISCAVIPLL